MPDPLAPADPSLLSSLLDTARLPGFMARNLLKGNLEGVGRNVVDLLGRTADAFVPGDWIPDISRKEDRPEFKDWIDLGGDNLGTDILNFAGDVATDPVSYIPGAQFAKAGNLVKAGIGKVVSKLPEAIQTPLREGAATIGRNVRSVAGAQQVSPETASALLGKQAASDLVSRTGSEATVNALSGLTPKEQLAVGQAGHNLRLDPVTGRPVSVLDESGTMTMDQRLQKLMAEDPELSPERLLKALPQVQGKLKTMWESGQEAATSPGGGIFFKNEAPATPDLLMGGYKTEANQGVQDYFPKQFSGLKADEIDELTGLPKNLPGQTPALGGAPAPVRERLDWTPSDILSYMAQNPKVNLEFNAAKALAARDAAQAELAGRAQVGQSLFERAANGTAAMPDELVRALAAKQNPAQKAVVGASNAGSDVGQMLGGRATKRVAGSPPNELAAIGRAAPAPEAASGVESIRRSAAERSNKTANEIEADADDIDRAAAADAERILGKEKAKIWMRGKVGEEWLEKLKDSGHFSDLPPGTAFGSPEWEAKLGPLTNKFEDTKPLRQFAQKIREMEQARDAEDIGVILGGRIPDIVRANAKDPAEWTMSESAAVSLYKAAQRAAVKNGISPKDVEDRIAQYAQQYGYTPWQLEDLAAANKPGSRASGLSSHPGDTEPLRIGHQPEPTNAPPLAQASPNVSKMLGGTKAAGIGEQSGKAIAPKAPRPPEYGPPPAVTDAERKSAQDYLKSKSFRYADPELKKAAQDIAKQFPAEEATVLLHALNGMGPKNNFTSALDKLNSLFKGAAIYGAVVPKLGSITRNLVGGLAQTMANAEARGDTLRAATKLVPNWLHAVDDGIGKLFGTRIGKNEFQAVDDAYKMAAGDPRKVASFIQDPMMREAVQNGILGNTFVNTEQIIKSAAQGGWKSFGKNLLTYPADMFQGAETRMRYGLYRALREKGRTPEQATKTVTDAFFDYSVSSPGNRVTRSIFPFAQFLMKAAPQQAKFLAEKPLALSATANIQGDSRGPIYPNMAGHVNIPIGKDEQGNQQYLSSLGLPVEAIGSLPNPSANLLDFGRQVEQNIVGASQPLLKAAYSVVSGREPYQGSQYGSYGRLPIVGEAGATGRTINQLLGTGAPGAIQAAGILGTLGKATDERTSIPEKLAGLLTGARIQSVDESRALQQTLEEALKRDPSIAQYVSLSNRDHSDAAQQLLDSLKAAKADLKAKRKMMASPN